MSLFNSVHADQRGFTLTEMLVSFAIIGMIMAGLLSIWMSGNTGYLTGANQVEAQENARAAIDRMARDIRSAGLNPQNAAINPVVGQGACSTANNTSPTAIDFMLFNDGNGDGVIQATECILYVLNGTNLDRRDFGVDAAPQTVIGGVQALAFTYFDGTGAQLAAPVTGANVRSIGIQITTQPQTLPGNWQSGRVSVAMNDLIRLRNR
jgi:type IV pilus assembly protein PilW